MYHTMSHFNKITTQMTDLKALVRALGRLGCEHIEVHNQSQSLYGFHGDARPQTAHVIIRRNYISASANDVGFEKQKDGTIIAHISDYDSGTGQYSGNKGTHGTEWQTKLKTYYGVEKAKMAFESKGMKYAESVNEKGLPVLKATIATSYGSY